MGSFLGRGGIMTKTTLGKVQGLRKERNSDVIRRMKNGDQLSSFNSYSSWFPPRPIIEKDSSAVKDLYGTTPRVLRNINSLDSDISTIEAVSPPKRRRLRLA